MMNKNQVIEHTKNMNAFTIDVDGTIEEVKPENGNDFSLDEMYKHTQSEMVQVVPLRSTVRLMVCDEEGIMNDKPVNRVATSYLAGDVFMPPQGQLGKVLICDRDMIQ